MAGLVVGIIAGSAQGAIGAAIQGGSWRDIGAGALAGGVIGGAVGFWDPSFGVGTLAIIGGVAGGLGDIAGQKIANYGEKCKSINWGSTAGAVAGGAMAGWGGGVFNGLSRVIGKWGATGIGAAITSGPAVSVPAVGAAIVGEGDSSQCGCSE